MVIKKLHKRIKKYLSSPKHARTISLVILLCIVLAIPLTVVVVQTQRDIREHAAADSTFRSVDTNKCGSLVDQPQAGVLTGTITWKAPVKTDTEWETQKTDEATFTQQEMKDAYVAEPRNGGTAESRAGEWETHVVSPTHINCNTFINISADGDCSVEFVDGIGSSDHPVAPGGTVRLAFTVDTADTGGFCRKLINVETAAVAITSSVTPTPSPMLTATPSVTPTPTSTSTPTPTKLPTPTLTPKPTVIPTPTIPFTPTLFSLSVALPGIGKNGNGAPNNMQRPVFLQLFDTLQKQVGASVSGELSFNGATFTGLINFGTIVPSGTYKVKIKMDQYLVKTIASASAVTAGITNTLPQITLIPGDINNDTKLDIVDYNILVSCFDEKINSDGCGMRKVDADLNDDGMIDGIDYNIFVRALQAGKQGE